MKYLFNFTIFNSTGCRAHQTFCEHTKRFSSYVFIDDTIDDGWFNVDMNEGYWQYTSMNQLEAINLITQAKHSIVTCNRDTVHELVTECYKRNYIDVSLEEFK